MRILAFNVAHDSSVCVFNDGKVEFFCKEERLTRIKRAKHPVKSLELLQSLNLGKIDLALYCIPSNYDIDCFNFYKDFIEKTFAIELEDFSSFTHHLCHASLAYHNSRFSEALVFVIDRNGSIIYGDDFVSAKESESVYLCSKLDFSALHKNFWLTKNGVTHKDILNLELKKLYGDTCEIVTNSELGIVKVYEAATTLIGQDVLDNGKTMGLSSYGEYYGDALFKNNTPLDNLFVYDKNDFIYFSDYLDLVTKDINLSNYKFYADIAKKVQIDTQNQSLTLIKKYIDKTGITNVCIVGGYGLNVVANNYYIQNLPNVKFYFEPVADDTGISIGAAMLKYRMIKSLDNSIMPLKDNFYHYYCDKPVDIGKVGSTEEICNLLISQKSVAIFEGNPEAGPRALGHRSILFDARNNNGKDIVNLIKRREWYRPFAGIVLKSHFKEYFETCGLDESKFMTINFYVKEKTLNLVPAICHIDKTCRIQTIDESNGFLYELLSLFYEKTNCPMLLNTSFNLAGEPLVHTIDDALYTLKNSTLDAVYFVDNNRLILNGSGR